MASAVQNESGDPNVLVIDVTDTLVLGSWTGIQRVVRKLAEELDRQTQVRLVAAMDGRFHELNETGRQRLFDPGMGSSKGTLSGNAKNSLKQTLLSALHRVPRLYLTLQEMSLNRKYRPSLIRYVQPAPYVCRPGQNVVLLDTYWGGTSSISAASKTAASGARVFAVVYDLIAVTHPHFVPSLVAIAFPRRLKRAIEAADGLLVISRTGVQQLTTFVGRMRRSPPIRHFHLGSDILAERPGDGHLSTARSRARYIMVGTIEPRKGHVVVLDAFERLWSAGAEAELIFAGRFGWVEAAFVERCITHSEKGNRFRLANSLGDRELAAMIEDSSALIMASEAEGFGLPIVEALAVGVPVIASDLAVFREIGDESILYFDHTNPGALADAIQTFEADEARYRQLAKEFQWIDWRQSASQFLQALESMA